ncbi:hypothetical protein [Tamlana crocina]|uniref:Uncharacterized protein n=1 Tax=Tamlana crocina TaxID=393006 RepID=A0ABX1DDX8_9FLAO|nr:hypothetical protein [Tamlana crocina]NJX16538.1 hypothetical protein [Tamlana crocina]
MIARWCISIFIFSLTLFGVVNQQQAVLPNQEVVLQFNEGDLSSDEAQGTINLLKQQLQSLGAKNIQVDILENGSVNIAYHCTSDVVSIKNRLSKARGLALDVNHNTPSSSLPIKGDKNIDYNIDIFEIHTDYGQSGDLNGNLVLQIDTKSDRYLEPCSLIYSPDVVDNQNLAVKLAFAVCKHIEIATKDIPHKIPEGRAGPSCS